MKDKLDAVFGLLLLISMVLFFAVGICAITRTECRALAIAAILTFLPAIGYTLFFDDKKEG
jgi:hypothetical protein